MDGLLDFLTDYPLALVLIIFFVARVVRGMKKGSATAESGTLGQQPPKSSDSVRRERVERQLAEQLRELGIDLPLTPSRSPADRSIVQPPRMEEESHQLAAPASGRSMGAVESSGEKTFAFRSTMSEPEAVQYHLAGFGGFHEAHGIGRSSAAHLDSVETAEPQGTSVPTDVSALRNGMLLAEILAPPVILRRARSGGRVALR